MSDQNTVSAEEAPISQATRTDPGKMCVLVGGLMLAFSVGLFLLVVVYGFFGEFGAVFDQRQYMLNPPDPAEHQQLGDLGWALWLTFADGALALGLMVGGLLPKSRGRFLAWLCAGGLVVTKATALCLALLSGMGRLYTPPLESAIIDGIQIALLLWLASALWKTRRADAPAPPPAE